MARAGQRLGSTGAEESQGGKDERKAFEFHGVTISIND
jgi:hypothetical protein